MIGAAFASLNNYSLAFCSRAESAELSCPFRLSGRTVDHLFCLVLTILVIDRSLLEGLILMLSFSDC